MNLKPDILGVLYISGVVILTLFVWRTVAGLATANPATEPIGKSMLAVTG